MMCRQFIFPNSLPIKKKTPFDKAYQEILTIVTNFSYMGGHSFISQGYFEVLNIVLHKNKSDWFSLFTNLHERYEQKSLLIKTILNILNESEPPQGD